LGNDVADHQVQLGVVAPALSVVYRFGFASLALFAFCATRRIRHRFSLRDHASFAAIGILQYALNYVLLYLSEEHLTSGLVAVVYVLVLVWNLAGTRLVFGTPMLPSIAIGASIGVVGVTLVFWPEISRLRAPGQSLGIALAVLGTLVTSAGNVWSQRLYGRGVAVVPSTAWSMLYGTLAVAVYCAIRGIPFSFDCRLSYVASLTYLSIFGSVVAFVSFLTLLARIGAGRAGYVAVSVPVLAMAMSTVFEGYRASALALSGMSLVLVGNALMLRGDPRSRGAR
jgi:drug/metabolite transporter (DMT)-like permease